MSLSSHFACLHWRRIATGALVALACAACLASPAGAQNETDELLQEVNLEVSEEMLNVYADSLVKTGVKTDQIPPINRPEFISVSQASLDMEQGDQVFVLDTVRPARIYPRNVLLWHQIVDDSVGERPFSIAHCPLTGTLVGVEGQVGAYLTSLGNAEGLLNHGMVMYDRSTGSLWPPILGVAIDGPLKGKRLTTFPLLWTDWNDAMQVYPDAEVLARPTMQRRPYNRDPYGDIDEEKSFYNNEYLFYPLTNQDDRLPAKEPILGLKVEAMRVAVVKSSIKSIVAGNFDAGLTPVAAFYDWRLDTSRLFDRRVNGRTLTFQGLSGAIYDDETRTEWSPRGEGLSGPLSGERLEPLHYFDCYWFAWAAFYPGALIVRWNDGSTAGELEGKPW